MHHDGAWHVSPSKTFDQVTDYSQKTWAGPINQQMYGTGLNDLCNRTKDNLNRLSLQMQKMDPCLEYGIKHWHPTKRPKSAVSRMERSNNTTGHVNVMFADSSSLDTRSVRDDSDFIDPPAPVNKFCYLCSTLEEHQRHMLHHIPKKRPATARPRIAYIAPTPKQKKKTEEDDTILAKERLYKVEVFTSDVANAGTNAKVFIAIKGSKEVLPRYQLVKKQGCSKMCFVQNSKEVFHIKGPFLGNLQILSIEHDGKERRQAWHLDRVEVTDIKAMKTWVFQCHEWLSIFNKPLYSNRVDLQAEEKDRPFTEYNIEIYTGKQKMAGTDSKIYITLYGKHGSSKKIHLADTSSDKRLFEKNSVDRFKFRMHGLGELKQIRIEHDGSGFAAGWFFDKAVVYTSAEPSQKYYFTYGGWIAKDEGDGKLWREIKAKKHLPKEIQHGTDTKYTVITKTGDVRFAGTDADVFIQMAGTNGITPKINIDNPKNNFERKMVDNFEVTSVNVGPLKHIVIGHDNSGPGAGWFLDTVTVRRYVPKDEAVTRLKAMKKKQRAKELKNPKQKQKRSTDDEDSDTELKKKIDKHEKEKKDARKEKKKKDAGNFFTVSSDSSDSSSSDSDSDNKKDKRLGRPSSALRRPGSALRRSNDKDSRGRKERSSSSESERGDKRSFTASPQGRRSSSASQQSRLMSERRVSTSASGRKQLEDNDDREYERRRSGRKQSTTDTDSVYVRRGSKSPSGRKQLDGKASRRKIDPADVNDDDNLKDLRVPLYEEYEFVCRKWLAVDEDDGLCVRELPVVKKTTFYKN